MMVDLQIILYGKVYCRQSICMLSYGHLVKDNVLYIFML